MKRLFLFGTLLLVIVTATEARSDCWWAGQIESRTAHLRAMEDGLFACGEMGPPFAVPHPTGEELARNEVGPEAYEFLRRFGHNLQVTFKLSSARSIKIEQTAAGNPCIDRINRAADELVQLWFERIFDVCGARSNREFQSQVCGASQAQPNETVEHLCRDTAPGCSDDELLSEFGLQRGQGRNDLQGFDSQFRGRNGESFREMVSRVAEEFGLNPGCLGSSALSETGNNRPWISQGPVDSFYVGLDGWSHFRDTVGTGIPDRQMTAADCPNCSTDPYCILQNGICHAVNELGVTLGPK